MLLIIIIDQIISQIISVILNRRDHITILELNATFLLNYVNDLVTASSNRIAAQILSDLSAIQQQILEGVERPLHGSILKHGWHLPGMLNSIVYLR